MKLDHLIASTGLFLAVAVGTVSAQPAGPAADFKIDPEHTATSPDGTTTIEQYAKIASDGDYTWQFWARRPNTLTLLKPEQPDYAAGFRFTNDSRWLVRMQKTGSGEASLYLYRLGPQGFVAATSKAFDGWLGLLLEPSRVQEGQQAGFPYRGGSRERNRRQLSLIRPELAR
jgi:hypothetical protein